METQSQSRKAERREQEYQLRRQEIMNAARTLFIQKGFRNTTLDEIAEQSAFGKGTIYNYFTNKDDLFHAIIHQLIEETFAAIRAAMANAGEGTRAKLYAYALATVVHFHENNEVFLMIMREHHQIDSKVLAQFVNRFEEKLSLTVEPLRRGMETGDLRPADPRKLAALFDGLLRTYCMMNSQQLWPSSKQPPTEIAELIVSIFFDGIENKPNQE